MIWLGKIKDTARCDLRAILEYELLASWWARLSTGASREAPVDNECLGKYLEYQVRYPRG